MRNEKAWSRLPIDTVLAWYFFLMAGLTLVFARGLASFPKIFALYLACATLAMTLPWLTREWKFHRQILLRAGLCILLIPTAFLSLAILLPSVNPDDRSWQLLTWDRHLFGGDTVRVASGWRLPVLSDVLVLAYASYYFLPMVLGAVLCKAQKWAAFERMTFAVGFAFLLSYLCYFFFPARSPYLILPDLDLHGSWIAESFQAFVVHAGKFKSEAFPSGHTGVTIVTLALAWRYERRTFWCLLPIAAGLVVATVVLGYHYVVDLIVGVAFAVGVLALLRICGGAEDEKAEKA